MGRDKKNNNGQAWSSNINISKQRQKAAPTRSSSHAKSKLRSPPPLPLRTPSKREGGSKKYGEWSETMSDVMPTEKKKNKKTKKGRARQGAAREAPGRPSYSTVDPRGRKTGETYDITAKGRSSSHTIFIMVMQILQQQQICWFAFDFVFGFRHSSEKRMDLPQNITPFVALWVTERSGPAPHFSMARLRTLPWL